MKSEPLKERFAALGREDALGADPIVTMTSPESRGIPTPVMVGMLLMFIANLLSSTKRPECSLLVLVFPVRPPHSSVICCCVPSLR